MSLIVPAVTGALSIGGVFLLVSGAIRRIRPVSTASSTGMWISGVDRWKRQSLNQRRWLLVVVAISVVAFLATRLVLAAFVVPAVLLILPWLLTAPPNRDVTLLSALDRWVRGLVTSIPTGKSVTDAIRATSARVPDELAGPVRLMIVRLDERWSTEEALRRFADELDSPDADAVIAALILAVRRGGTGAAMTLRELSESVQHRLEALREIDAERAKPRIVVRQVTIITLVVLTLALVTSPAYFQPYQSPLGQALLVILVAIYLGSLAVLRSRTQPRQRRRILDPGSAVGVQHD